MKNVRPRNDAPSDLRIELLSRFLCDEASGPGPKRARLYRAILKMIAQGFWNAGDRLPTDVEFARVLPLSVATIQATLNALAEQGILTRKQREGTFVASENVLPRDFAYFFRFSKSNGEGLAGLTEVLAKIEEISGTGIWSEFLGPREHYLRFTRIAEIDEAFRVLSKVYLAEPRLWALLDLPPSSVRNLNLRSVLQLRFGLPIVSLDWRVGFTTFDVQTCKATRTARGTVGQRFDVRMRTVDGKPLGLHRLWVPPNDYTMIITGES